MQTSVPTVPPAPQPFMNRATGTFFGDNPMKLMTTELEKRFAEVGRQEDKVYDALVVARYFDPCGSWTWYATEYYPKDRLFFGYVSGLEDEFGDFSLDEMEQYKGRFGIGLERDLYFDEMPLRQALKKDRKVVPDG